MCLDKRFPGKVSSFRSYARTGIMNDTALGIIGREKGFLETLFSRETKVDGLEHGFQNVYKKGERRFNKCMKGV